MNGYCELCGAPAEAEHHLVFGRGLREIADRDRLKIKICNRCHTTGAINERIHDNPMAEKLSKALGQAIWERNFIAKQRGEDIEFLVKEDAKEAFRERYGRSYL